MASPRTLIRTAGVPCSTSTCAGAEAATVRSISPALAQIAVEALEEGSKLDPVDGTRGFDRNNLTFTRYVRLRDEAANLAAAELGVVEAADELHPGRFARTVPHLQGVQRNLHPRLRAIRKSAR